MVWRPATGLRLQLRPAPTLESVELPRGHIPALDALRGLAILVVTLYRFGGGGDGPASAIEHPWLIGLGARGVDLFFVLSGFLITGILYDAKLQAHYFRNFYIRRSLRIFPLYFLALFVTLLVLPAALPTFAEQVASAQAHQAWLWLYGANVLQAIRGEWCLGPLNHFWSLAIEEHFYLLWPAVICFTSRRTALGVCGLLFVASVTGRVLWLAAGGNNVAAEVLTPLRMDGLVLGAALALIAREPNGLLLLRRWAWPCLLVAGAMALALDLADRRLFGARYALWAVACGALLVILVAARQKSALWSLGRSRLLRFFGKYSYGMYVFQLPLIYLLAPLLTAGGLATACSSPLTGQLAYAALMFGITTFCALVSWQLFEKRLLTLKSHFESAPGRAE